MTQDHIPQIPKDTSLTTTRVYGDASIMVIQHGVRQGDDVRVSYTIHHLPGVEVMAREYQGSTE